MQRFHTRFAPSPTGALHRGHIFAACVAKNLASQNEGKFILRIDDIDHTRCKKKFVEAIYNDLKWLGLEWDGKVQFQSERLDAYSSALKKLKTLDLIYPCFLSRKELGNILSAPHGKPTGSMIRNTDKILSSEEQKQRADAGRDFAWRLRMQRAKKLVSAKRITWFDAVSGKHKITPEIFGDVVIARGDIGLSYHLAVVVDDALDKITVVTRGNDLKPSTHLHVLLQNLLGLPSPMYLHHELICDENGQRLAKRSAAHSISQLRNNGLNRHEILDDLPTLPKTKIP